MVADQGLDAGWRGAAADHGVRIDLGQGSARELAGAAAHGAKERALRIRGQAGAIAVCRQDLVECVMAGHGVVLAAFLVQPYPQPAFLREDILDLYRESVADAGELVHHQRDEGAIAQPGRRRGADRIEQPPRFGRIEHRRLS